MKIATWNVNSLKIRLPQVIDWLQATQTDVLMLQELKMSDDVFPADELSAIGYHSVFLGQKTYNGVAILSKQALTDVQFNIPNFADEQKRLVAANLGDLRLICVYIPNGQAIDSEKYPYKLSWLDAFNAYLAAEVSKYPQLVLGGDFNIAPADADVHDPAQWTGQVLCSEPERQRFEKMLAMGLVDSFRQFEQAPKTFSWWDYRMLGFQKNKGLRIDHLLISQALVPKLQSCIIDRTPRKLKQPSDHAPVVIELFSA